MTTLEHTRPAVDVPPVRQDVIDQLASRLASDDRLGYRRVEREQQATRSEAAAAAIGVIDGGGLDLAALQHALEVLDSVTGLPDPAA